MAANYIVTEFPALIDWSKITPENFAELIVKLYHKEGDTVKVGETLATIEEKETSKEERPNKPVSKGRRGSFTGREKVRKPRNPERVKIIRELRKESSVKIRNKETKIRMKGIMI